MSFDRVAINQYLEAARVCRKHQDIGTSQETVGDQFLRVCLIEIDRLTDDLTCLAAVKIPSDRNVALLCETAATNLARAEQAEAEVAQLTRQIEHLEAQVRHLVDRVRSRHS